MNDSPPIPVDIQEKWDAGCKGIKIASYLFAKASVPHIAAVNCLLFALAGKCGAWNT